MANRLVTLLSEKPDGGKSAFEEAIRNCCQRGGYDLVVCGTHSGNKEPTIRIHHEHGEIEHEASGYAKAAQMLLKRRLSPLSATAEHLPIRSARQRLSPLQQAGELVGAT